MLAGCDIGCFVHSWRGLASEIHLEVIHTHLNSHVTDREAETICRISFTFGGMN